MMSQPGATRLMNPTAASNERNLNSRQSSTRIFDGSSGTGEDDFDQPVNSFFRMPAKISVSNGSGPAGTCLGYGETVPPVVCDTAPRLVVCAMSNLTS